MGRKFRLCRKKRSYCVHCPFTYCINPSGCDPRPPCSFHCHVQLTHKKPERLRDKIVESVEKNGVDVEEETHNDLLTVWEKCSEEELVKYPQDSFQQIFWQQQLQYAQLSSNRRQRRWHPLMTKWALYLRHLSSKAYETVDLCHHNIR